MMVSNIMKSDTKKVKKDLKFDSAPQRHRQNEKFE